MSQKYPSISQKLVEKTAQNGNAFTLGFRCFSLSAQKYLFNKQVLTIAFIKSGHTFDVKTHKLLPFVVTKVLRQSEGKEKESRELKTEFSGFKRFC